MQWILGERLSHSVQCFHFFVTGFCISLLHKHRSFVFMVDIKSGPSPQRPVAFAVNSSFAPLLRNNPVATAAIPGIFRAILVDDEESAIGKAVPENTKERID